MLFLFFQVTGEVMDNGQNATEWTKDKMEATPHKADQSTEQRGHPQATQLDDEDIKQRMTVTCMYHYY